MQAQADRAPTVVTAINNVMLEMAKRLDDGTINTCLDDTLQSCFNAQKLQQAINATYGRP